MKEDGILANADKIMKDHDDESFDKNASLYNEGDVKPSVRERAKITPYRLLTDEDKLALAQEKRGCTTPPEKERKTLIQIAHERGHFGVTAIFRDLSNQKVLVAWNDE